MKNVMFGLLASVVLSSVPATANAAELVTNGGFETGDFTGWSQFGSTNNSGVDPLAAFSGNFGAFFGAVGSTGGITQTLNTVIGQTYTISLYAQIDQGTPNYGIITFGGQTLDSTTNSAGFDYRQLTYSAVATSALTALTFEFRHDPAFFQIDDISVTGLSGAVPEPATWAMMILGMGAVGGAMRRKQAVKASVRFA
jgi:hypothetical protein